MSTTLVFTLVGSDRPGLVREISDLVSKREANWEASHMARLGGRFAGIVEISSSKAQAEALQRDLESIKGLRVIVDTDSGSEEPAGEDLHLELVGSDRPGIIREISSALASRGVTVLELSSEVGAAPMGGGKLFSMHAQLRCPLSLDRAELQRSLEALANELMVELQIDE